MMNKYTLRLIFLGILFLNLTTAKAQPSLEVFGQNRIQYRQFKWSFYEAKHFKIYHYDRSGKQLARYVAEQAEKDLEAIQQKSGALFNEKLGIILYNSYDDYQQSNIGLNSELQMQNNNPAGTVNIIGDKLVVYFTGKHSDLKRQLRQGMAQMIMERLMFGDNFKEIVRNAVLLDLPEWVTAGYVDYIVDGWTAKDENDWKNKVMQSEKVFFNELALENPRLGGKAFWKYVAFKYSESTVREILYDTQLKGSLNKALKLRFNQNIKNTFDSVIVFYKEKYLSEAALYDSLKKEDALITIPLKNDESEIRNVMVSPRGFDVAYVQWKHGEYEVVIEKTKIEGGKKVREKTSLLSGGIKDYMAESDPDYPLMAWSNTGFKLGMIYRRNNKLFIKVYNSVKGKVMLYKIPARRFDRVTGFTFMEDDEMIVLSAIKNGKSDLFELRLKGARLTQITDDEWDDLNPVFVSGGSRRGVVFLSNRPKPVINIQPLPNELPIGMMNAYFYSTTTKSYDLLQLTNEKKGTISDIVPYGSDHFAYLSDKNGVRNRYVVLFARDVNNRDSAYSVPVTNYQRSISYQQYNAASAKIAEAIQYNDAFYVYFTDIKIPAATDAKSLPELTFIDGIRKAPRKEEENPIKHFEEPGTIKNSESETNQNNKFEIESGDYYQSEFSRTRPSRSEDSASVMPDEDSKKMAEALDLNHQQDKINERIETVITSSSTEEVVEGKRVLYVDSTFISLRSKPYFLSFRPDFFSIRLDNSLIFNRYQPYTNSGGEFVNPSLSGMLMAKLFDKMEDYRFTGGIQIPTNFSGMTYFFQFENFRRRIDWGLVFLRSANNLAYSFIIDPTAPSIEIPGKTLTHILQGNVTYPLDKVRSIHFHLGLRQDRMIVKGQDFFGVLLPNVQDIWWMNRLEYVYDNTKSPAMNIWKGSRYKIFGEYLYKIYTDNEDIYTLTENEYVKNGGFFNVGVDYRSYIPIYKNFIAAFRFAGAHSLGSQQVIYYLGGKENAFGEGSEVPLPPSNKNNYAFQSLASNLRGYGQNARNGNTYLLMNAELRLPIFTTFFRRPFQSSILNNLQAVAFLDIGNAWEGLVPNSANLNRNYQLTWPPNNSSPIVKVQIPNYNSNGLAIGYGGGLRTLLFGYFVAFDAAWNVDRKFHWYFSIGTDF